MTTVTPSLPDYAELVKQLAAAEADFSAAELHGIVTGLACTDAPGPGLAQLLPETAPHELVRAVARMFAATLNQLRDEEFGFVVLLPDDETPLPEQLAGLADWSRGFVVGLSAGGVRDVSHLSESAAEVIRDLSSIAEASLDGLPRRGEAESRQLTELVEYVRVGAQLVFDELHSRRARAH